MAPEAVAPPVKRLAMELAPEDLQSEYSRYGIPAGDSAARLQALQRKYDDEFDAGTREHEAFLHRVEMEKTKAAYHSAVHNVRALELQALECEPKVRTIVRQIEQNVAPKQLVVRSISPLACCALLRAMRENANVMSLDLATNALTDAVATALGKMLAANKTLRALNLASNGLTSRFLAPLGEGLQENHVLSSLVLESNPIFQLQKDHASAPMPSAVKSTSSQSLEAMFETLRAFLTAIEKSTALTAINLFNTGMSYEIGRALCRAVAKNSTIVSLELGGNSLAQTDLVAVSKHLEDNQQRASVEADDAAMAMLTIRERAETNRREQEQLAKQKADTEWHEENARKRTEIREQEEWERARIKAEEEVAHLLQMEAENKKYIEMREAEKKPKGKAKK
jgi:hypothetical protein